MNCIWHGCCLAAAAALFFGCRKPVEISAGSSHAIDSGPSSALPKLRTLKLWLGREELAAEVAGTPLQIQTGMMFRTNITEMDGMLFILPYTQQASFWMKNCPLPLSAAYIDPEGVIQEIREFQPHDTNAVVSVANNIRFVLETPQGWFQRHNVRTGMTVRTELGSLMDTFFGGR